MRMFAVAMFAAVLAIPALSAAGDRQSNAALKPMSFVPHPNSGQHVYGSPISQPIVGHARTSHQKQSPKKQPRSVSSHAPTKHRAKRESHR